MKKYFNAFLSLTVSLILAVSIFITPSFALDESSSAEETVTVTEETSAVHTKTYRDYDLTGDGKFTISDIRIFLRVTAKLDAFPEDVDTSVFDMDNNGMLTTADVRLMLRDFLGIVTSKTEYENSTKQQTTEAPTTQAPTTQAPTTEAPTTQAPTTEAPVTTTRNKMEPVDSDKVLGNEGSAFRESAVYDLTNDQMLYSYNAETAAYPASMTKLMTALVASKYVPMDYVITVGSEIYLTESNSSLSYIQPGYRMTMQDLITSLLLPSGCDSAYCIAVQTAKYLYGYDLSNQTALNKFVNLMNSTASELGCINTHFVNPSGFPYSDHYTCARDMVLIAKEVYWNRTLRLIASWYKKTVTIESGQTLTYENSNKLLWQSSDYYYDYAMGMKTGTTSEAGCCLTAAAEKDGRALLVIIMGADWNKDRYNCAINYFEHYFNKGY